MRTPSASGWDVSESSACMGWKKTEPGERSGFSLSRSMSSLHSATGYVKARRDGGKNRPRVVQLTTIPWRVGACLKKQDGHIVLPQEVRKYPKEYGPNTLKIRLALAVQGLVSKSPDRDPPLPPVDRALMGKENHTPKVKGEGSLGNEAGERRRQVSEKSRPARFSGSH